ncbi:MAG: response regulator transcription factor [Deferrisomatales bacterium]|nr:response regulator transcription factor [Deferrisomatales bacterium]
MALAHRIIIVDPRGMIREALSILLDAHPEIEVVGQAATGEEGIRLVEDLGPDVALVETELSDMDGNEATRQIKDRRTETRVLILTEEFDDKSVRAAFRAGADGYVLKQADPDEIRMAVVRAARGSPYLGPEVTARVLEVYLAAESELPGVPAPLRELTHRERELLALVAEGLTSREIGDRLGISSRTADKHKSNIMRKLNIHNVGALTAFSIRELTAGAH